MIVPCPKCDAKTELDLSHISEEGTSAKCPECKTRFWITKESFARRALKKDGKTLCSFCNHELSNYLDCPTCGVMYPDFCVVQTSKPVRKKTRKTSGPISFSIRPQRKARSVVSQQRPTEKASKSLLNTVGLVVLVALVAVAAGVTYSKMKSERQYTENLGKASLSFQGAPHCIQQILHAVSRYRRERVRDDAASEFQPAQRLQTTGIRDIDLCQRDDLFFLCERRIERHEFMKQYRVIILGIG